MDTVATAGRDRDIDSHNAIQSKPGRTLIIVFPLQESRTGTLRYDSGPKQDPETENLNDRFRAGIPNNRQATAIYSEDWRLTPKLPSAYTRFPLARLFHESRPSSRFCETVS